MRRSARVGGSERRRGNTSAGKTARREEQPKTDETLHTRDRTAPFRMLFRIRPLLALFTSSVSRIVALTVAYRYGYGIRHTSRSTNGYFAGTISRYFLQEMLPRAGSGAITNDEGGKSRSNFPLREPKEAFGSLLTATAVAE